MRLASAALIAALLAATSATATPVRFVVDVPACTPTGSTVLLRSNRSSADTFVHDVLNRVGDFRWEGTFDVSTDRSSFRYKYSHAICDANGCPGIEKSLEFRGTGADAADRTLTATQAVTSDLVYIWRDALTRFDSDGQSIGARGGSEQVAFCAPYLSISGPNEVTIGFDSYYGSNVTLEYGPTTSYGTTVSHQAQYRNHFTLTGLTPGQVYHYRIIEDGQAGGDHAFVAPVAPGAEFRFAVLGDTQYYVERQRIDQKIFTDLILGFDPHLILSTGDMVASERGPGGPGGWMYPEMARWNVFFGIAAPLLARAPFMSAMGNHEEDAPYYWDVFRFPRPDAPAIDHYAFRYGHVFFVALYTGHTDGYDAQGILDSQTDWLERELSTADADPSIRYKVVFLHRGHFSQGNRHNDGGQFYEGGTATRPSWRSLLQTHGVDLVLGGHNHNFTLARADGIYFMTACSGAPVHELRAQPRATTLHAEERCTANLFTVRPNTITFEPRRADGTVIQEANLSLCHQALDCHELPSECPGITDWACVDNACRATCLENPDAGMSDASVADGGEEDAAGLDAGSMDAAVEEDASLVDANPSDSSVDADADAGLPDARDDGGSDPPDASVESDAGYEEAPASGCGCRSHESSGGARAWPGLLLALGLLLRSLRSRRGSMGRPRQGQRSGHSSRRALALRERL